MQGVVALVCHPMAPMVYTGCLDGVLRAWDIRTGAALMVPSAYHLPMWHWKLYNPRIAVDSSPLQISWVSDERSFWR